MNKEQEFKPDDWLPIDLIRSHTKTDDIPYVTDELLRLYRNAAIESAEAYTGFIFGPLRTVIERVENQPKYSMYKRHFKYTLRHVSGDGRVLYNSELGHKGVIEIEPRSRTVRLPLLHTDPDCCSRCGANEGVKIQYQTGYCKASEIPSGIKLGCLKFIAWMVSNPGDELVTMLQSTAYTRGSVMGVGGTNNVSWASGALELWRQYRDDGA